MAHFFQIAFDKVLCNPSLEKKLALPDWGISYGACNKSLVITIEDAE